MTWQCVACGVARPCRSDAMNSTCPPISLPLATMWVLDVFRKFRNSKLMFCVCVCVCVCVELAVDSVVRDDGRRFVVGQCAGSCCWRGNEINVGYGWFCEKLVGINCYSKFFFFFFFFFPTKFIDFFDILEWRWRWRTRITQRSIRTIIKSTIHYPIINQPLT